MVAKPETMENTFATAHAIQVTIDENIRLLAQLHAKWEREAKIDRNNSVCTITTKPQVVHIPTPTPTMPKPIEPTTNDAKFDFDIDVYNISEVIMFLQKLARSPDASDMCQASCTSQRNQKSELMGRASAIHLYTSTPPLTCDGQKSARATGRERRRTKLTYDSRGLYVDTERSTAILG